MHTGGTCEWYLRVVPVSSARWRARERQLTRAAALEYARQRLAAASCFGQPDAQSQMLRMAPNSAAQKLKIS
jgi:hypothetical protein